MIVFIYLCIHLIMYKTAIFDISIIYFMKKNKKKTNRKKKLKFKKFQY